MRQYYDHRPAELRFESCKSIRMMGEACAAGNWNATCLHGL